MKNLIADLRARGLVQDIMPGTEEHLLERSTTGYVWFDPTADSLHVGSLLPITLLMRLQRAGHRPIAIIGGATGMIGDPTGKSAERNLLDEDTLQRNCAGIEKQLRKFLKFDDESENGALLLDNYSWFRDFSFLNFIRDVGKHITVNYMLSKESVQKRLEFGLSFTEFSYQLIQGYDFYYLNKNYGVTLQMGGADQWGNMLTGTELIRRLNSEFRISNSGSYKNDQIADSESEIQYSRAFAFTCPLITKSDGGKFGKTESGNVWLDPQKTSPYQFYQFWLKLPDADAERMAYTFSFKEVEEIASLIEQHREAPHMRTLQKALAEELTMMVHSDEDLHFAKQASEILFSNKAVEALKQLNEQQLLEVMEGVPQVKGRKEALSGEQDFITFLAESGVLPSKGEARKMLQAGGISVNKEKAAADFSLTPEHLMHGKYLLIQKGKSNYTLAVFAD